MKTSTNIKAALTDIGQLIFQEFKTIFTSYAIVLVLTGGIFAYGLLYNYMYAPNLVENAPVVVVDNSRTTTSRTFIRLLNATMQVEVVASGINNLEARAWMKRNDAVGILYLPANFETNIALGKESLFIMYETTSAFLYYLAMQEASMSTMLALNEQLRPDMLVFLPQKDIAPLTEVSPMRIIGTPLYNHTEGYGSYLIPAVLMIIIFQTLMMLIAMVGGGERQTGKMQLYATKGTSYAYITRIILSKTFVYCLLYALFSLFLLGLMPYLFSLPHIGDAFDILVLFIPFLLSTSFLGLAAVYFYTDADAPLLMIAFFSVGLLFLSGVSYPLELMPWYWQASHYIVPAAPATLAFVKINSMGASLSDIRVEYVTLWVQVGVYFVLAVLSYGGMVRRGKRDR